MGVKDAEGPFLGFHALKHPGVPATNDLAGTLGVGAREDLLAQMIALESQLSAIELQQATHFMEAIRMSAESAECPSVAMIQRYGDLSDLLTDFENDTRLIVMGRRGKAHEGFRDAIGSHIERVIRKFHKPVLVVTEDFVVPKQFMIAFDGSQAGRKVFDLVANSSLMRERRCHLAIVDGDAGVIEGASNQLTEGGYEVRATELSGSVVSALVNYQERNSIDLTIMGAYGHSRIRQFFVGSQTTAMLHKSVTPLLFLR